MRLAKFTKRPSERKRYSILYGEWLDSGETVTNVTFGVTPSTGNALDIDASQIASGGKDVVFFANLGEEGVSYTVDVQITTSGGQIKKDEILFSVRNH